MRKILVINKPMILHRIKNANNKWMNILLFTILNLYSGKVLHIQTRKWFCEYLEIYLTCKKIFHILDTLMKTFFSDEYLWIEFYKFSISLFFAVLYSAINLIVTEQPTIVVLYQTK